MAHDVFVSHSSKDKSSAEVILARLEHEGIACWIAPRDVPLGKSYADSIIKGIESSRVMVLIFSSHSNDSRHVRYEVERAASKGVIIVPVRIEACEMSDTLEYFMSSSHWLKAEEPPLESHLPKLVRDIKLLLNQDGGEPAAPPTAPTEAIGFVGKPHDPSPQSESKSFFMRPLGIFVGVILALMVVISIWGSVSPESGVKLANEMDNYAVGYLVQHQILKDDEELIAYYDVTLGMDGTEAAILTSRRVLYHKNSDTNEIALTDIDKITSHDVGIQGDSIRVESESGKMIEITIAAANKADVFDQALRSQWQRAKRSKSFKP